nr:MAG TPA: hypothetical protein [Caudoviricetes sp.]
MTERQLKIICYFIYTVNGCKCGFDELWKDACRRYGF